MVSTNWTTSFQLRMVLLKKKWEPFKLVFSMSPSILSKFLLTLALDFRAGSSKPIPHDWINQGGNYGQSHWSTCCLDSQLMLRSDYYVTNFPTVITTCHSPFQLLRTRFYHVATSPFTFLLPRSY